MFKIKQCTLCGGKVKDITVKHLERWTEEHGIVFFKDVPAQQCIQCKEQFFSADVIEDMEVVLKNKMQPPERIRVEMPAYPKEVYLKSM